MPPAHARAHLAVGPPLQTVDPEQWCEALGLQQRPLLVSFKNQKQSHEAISSIVRAALLPCVSICPPHALTPTLSHDFVTAGSRLRKGQTSGVQNMRNGLIMLAGLVLVASGAKYVFTNVMRS